MAWTYNAAMSTEPEQAARLLTELAELRDRARVAVQGLTTGWPLIGWGIAWLIGYPAMQLADGWARIGIVGCCWALGILSSWIPSSRKVRTGHERQLRLGWLSVAAASPFIVAAAAPESWVSVALLLGALWSMCMCLFAIATGDRTFSVVSFVGVVAAGSGASQEFIPALVWFGLFAGLPLLAVGVSRVWLGRDHA